VKYRIGIDIGGTFTDFLVLDELGNIHGSKEPSSEKPEEAVYKGLGRAAKELGLTSTELLRNTELFIHGTTIVTNTLVSKAGPKLGLICTKGHRDTLYLRDCHRWDIFNIKLPHPDPFIPRYLRITVEERILYDGSVFIPLNENSVREACKKFKQWGVEAVAVCLLHSITNPVHENKIKQIVNEEMPGVNVNISSDVLPIVREWQRSAATAFNVYIYPGLSAYLSDMEEHLKSMGLKVPLLIMQNIGGCARVKEVLEKPIYCTGSGPTAGPVAGILFGNEEEEQNVITGDMGGTSFDTSLVRNGQLSYTPDLRISNIPFGVSAVDVNTIGAGGGSIAWVDSGGLLKIGPQSAGSHPGPACYNFGGVDPTVTDADLILGYLNPDYFWGGEMKIYPELAEKAIRDKIAKPLGISVADAAHGIFEIVNRNMAAAISVITIEKGIDPRGYSLIAGGGAGPIHAGKIAELLGMHKIIIPSQSAVFCSLGMCVTDIRHEYVKTFYTDSQHMDINRINEIYRDLETEAVKTLESEGIHPENIMLTRAVDAKYPAQFYELTAPVPSGVLTKNDVPRLCDAYHNVHDEKYAYCMRESPVAFLQWRLTAIGLTRKYKRPELVYAGEDSKAAQKGIRKAYFEEEKRFLETPIYDPSALGNGMVIHGPAMIETATTNVVICPEQKLKVSKYGNYVITR